jgi:hypothetical protein
LPNINPNIFPDFKNRTHFLNILKLYLRVQKLNEIYE